MSIEPALGRPQRRSRWLLAALLAGLSGLLAMAVVKGFQDGRHRASLNRRLASIQNLPDSRQVDCRSFAQAKPLVLLALGQSNAANHGPDSTSLATPSIRVLHEGRCGWMQEPLAGATGRGASLWSRLPSVLAAAGVQRPVVMAVLAVEATSAADWTEPGSPLRERLQYLSAGAKAANLQIDLVLWQQGEADALQGTQPQRYTEQLKSLAAQLSDAGIRAPILLARSTLCKSSPDAGLTRAMQGLIDADDRFALGPDTDALAAPWARRDGCHFTLAGLDAAAQAWGEVISRQLAARRSGNASSAPRPTPV